MTETTLIDEARSFPKQEDGAVTVDWVVLAAAVVLLAIPIGITVGNSVDTSAPDIGERVVDATDD